MNNEWHIEYEIPPYREIHDTIVSAPTRPAAERKVHADRPNSIVRIIKVEKYEKPSLPDRLDALSRQMHDVAVEMEYYGGFDTDVVQHSKELLGASTAVKTWADGLRDKEVKE